MKRLLNRLPRLNRKQRIARNLAAAAVCLFLLSWMMEFPALSREGLLSRAERMHLLEGTELLHDGRGGDGGAVSWPTLYARNGDTLMTVQYSYTPMGLQLSMVDLHREADNIFCFKRMHMMFDPMLAMAFGDLRGAARAELTYPVRVAIGSGNAQRVLLEETYVTEGTFLAENAVLFEIQAHYEDDDPSEEAAVERQLFRGEVAGWEENVVLRLYDESGALLHEKTMDHMAEEIYSCF